MAPEPEALEVGVRGWPTNPSDKYRRPPYPPWFEPVGPSEWVLVFDSETFTDHAQQFRFGCSRLYLGSILHKSAIFYDPESVTDTELDVLTKVAAERGWDLLELSDWTEEVFFAAAVDLSATVVGHNLFFDLTRIAIGHDTTRSRDRRMRGGISLKLSDDPTRPRVLMKKTSPTASFIQFAVPDGRPPEQRVNEKGHDVPPFRGFFADTATLANALLGGRVSLERLARTLGTPHQKTTTDLDGPITPETVDYCMNDVTVTWECFDKLKTRYDTFQLDVPLHRIISEASVGKAHLAQMGIKPWRQLQPDFPDWLIAILMESYIGGRTECHLRRCPYPGIYVDFTSHYPTSYVNQGLFHFQIAETIEWEEEDPDAINELVAFIGVEDLLEPAIWRELVCLVEVDPDGDLLPTRARYKPGSALFNVGIAHRYGEKIWVTLADYIVAKLESPDDRVPRATRVIRFKPGQLQGGMRPTNIAGQSDFRIDPYQDDFIQRLVELRADAKTRKGTAEERQEAELWDGIQHALKITANSDAYGIGIEINTTRHRKPQKAILHNTDGTTSEVKTRTTEHEGLWFNPLIATLTAAGGRLLLATLIRLVRDAGGDYVICDTDSLFITGLERHQVESIVAKYEQLNPYDPDLIPGSILENEDINYDPHTGEPRTIHAYSIASKRYAMVTREPGGSYRLAREFNASGELVAKRSEHGLGHLQAPSENFEDELWEWIINTDTGNDWPEPDWFDQPALGRMTINTPHDLKLFRGINQGKPYREQIRPGGFVTIAHPHPIEQRGLLIAPYTPDVDQALARNDWIDRASREAGLRIRTDKPEYVIEGSVAVLNYRHYAEQYMSHREWKARLNPDGRLMPRSVTPSPMIRLGKESDPLTASRPLDASTPLNNPMDPRRCSNCGSQLSGRQRKWCSEICRKAVTRRR